MIEEAKCVAGSRVIVFPFDSFVLVSHTDGWLSNSSTIRSAHSHSDTNKYFSPLLRINRLSGEFTNTWHWLVRAICQRKTNIRMFVEEKKWRIHSSKVSTALPPSSFILWQLLHSICSRAATAHVFVSERFGRSVKSRSNEESIVLQAVEKLLLFDAVAVWLEYARPKQHIWWKGGVSIRMR